MPKTEIRVPSGQVPVQAWADSLGADEPLPVPSK